MSTPLYQLKAEFFKTLGHPARIRILELLSEREYAVAEMLPEVGIEPAHLSQQLAVLRRANLVTFRKEGSSVRYSLTSPHVAELLAVARLILTGQAQSQGFQQSDFRDAVCARVHGLLDCANGLQIDVKTYSSFSSITNTKPIDTNGNLQTNFGYTPGNACDIVVVRLMYQWPVYVSLLGLNRLSDLSGNKKLIMATAAFRNEPFSSGSC